MTRDPVITWARRVQTGEVRAEEVLDHYLARIRATDGQVHGYLTVLEDGARRQARAVDALTTAERAGLPLAGVPVAVKDNIVWDDGPTTAASRILSGFYAPYRATAAARLAAAGAVVLGKTNLDEFAMGSSTEHSAFGPTRNPWDLDRVPGGSSGGSAAVVAAGAAPAALGSDTGGSIRQPAAFCGVVGLKPSYGRVSRFGLLAFASSLDQIGLLTRSVRDAALLTQVMAGYDDRDLTSLRESVPDWLASIDDGVRGLKVGLVEDYLEGVDPAVAAAVDRAAAALADGGAKVLRVALPASRYSLPAYYVISNAEASSNLARYDGVRYGHVVPADNIYRQYDDTRGDGFGPEVKRRIMLGTFALSAGYFDAYYRQAARVRTAIVRDFEAAFGQVDLLLAPTTPDLPFRFGERLADPWRMYLSDLCTVAVNLAGLPAMSVPAGLADNLPVGVQLIGPRLGEDVVFRGAAILEAAWGPWPLPALAEGDPA